MCILHVVSLGAGYCNLTLSEFLPSWRIGIVVGAVEAQRFVRTLGVALVDSDSGLSFFILSRGL